MPPTIVQRSLVSSGGNRRPDGYPVDGRGSRIILPPGTNPETSVVLLDGELPSGWEALADPETVLTGAPFNRPAGAESRLLAAGVPGAGVELLFQSRWDADTGNQNDALQDGIGSGNWKWPEGLCSQRHDHLTVIDGDALGWTRSPNVLRVEYRDEPVGNCGGAVVHDTMVPASTTHWGRLYFYSDMANYGEAWHNFSYSFLGDIHDVFFRPNGEAEGWYLGLHCKYHPDGTTFATKEHPNWARDNWLLQTSQANPSDGAEVTGTTSPNRILMNHGEWYRYEWMKEYVTANTTRMWPRLYNSAGALLYDASDFYNVFHLTESLEAYQNGGGAFGMNSSGGIENMRNIGIGSEGHRSTSSGEVFWYVGDFAISTEGWIGDTP